MNNFTIIYKILKALEKAMDLEKFDLSTISPDILKISDKFNVFCRQRLFHTA